jgi:hypothetical protein
MIYAIGWAALLVAPGALAWAFVYAAKRNDVRALVFSNLDSAYEGGQFEPDGYLFGVTADDLANDLTLYAEDCSGMLESELLPHVRAWMRARA